MKRLIISGYKANELGIFNNKHAAIPYIKKAIRNTLLAHIEDGLEWVIITGQWGTELWAGEVVHDLKREYGHLKLAVITPFLSMTEKWNEDKKEYYNTIVRSADFVDSVSKEEYKGPWQFSQANKFLIRNSDALLLLYDAEAHPESSPRFMKQLGEARVLQGGGYQLLFITMHDLQAIVEEEMMNREYEY
ncbi:DUF1273 domain-containing protein [Paenibacillus sp. GD4]|uniref:DUF1273 domain-containing protein n=1 Tax=Paenibacillus sp. GD4 TaxID=3068890 RepID=UPI00279657F6|nr:DUF1273 domain-containing protein [Paenibacillus sp. GD4]MDQ1912183.1 DUF1273 domain-containing protein [Paenibacillus sp. GD4]